VKILIIEDEPISQKVLVQQLSPLGTCSVASTSDEALKIYKDSFKKGEYFDLICLDIMIPTISGQEVLRHIREFEQGHSAKNPSKIIMTTGLDDPETVVTSFQYGCEGYITKPISKNRLMSELKKLGFNAV
jgi:two-component system, chemotaxis family, chemotaxis protein CheY